jgi:L-asparagine permease
VASQLRLYWLAKHGRLERPNFRMPLAPYSGYLTLVFLVCVLVLMLFDKVQGPWLLGAMIIGVPALIGGWFLVRHRVLALSQDAAPTPTPESVVEQQD